MSTRSGDCSATDIYELATVMIRKVEATSFEVLWILSWLILAFFRNASPMAPTLYYVPRRLTHDNQNIILCNAIVES